MGDAHWNIGVCILLSNGSSIIVCVCVERGGKKCGKMLVTGESNEESTGLHCTIFAAFSYI